MADQNYVSSEVPFSDDEAVSDEQLIVEDKPGDSPEVKAQRAQRRRERAAERERERKEQKETLTQVQRELAEERAARARLEGAVQAAGMRDRRPAEDPYKLELQQVYDEQRQAWLAAQAEVKAGTYTEERDAHYQRVGQQLETRKMQIHTRQAVAETAQTSQAAAGKAVWEQKYPEVYGNTTAYQYAEATFNRRKLLGEKATPELVDEVMEETRTAFKLGPKKGPSASDRAKLSGIPTGGSGGGATAGATGGIQMTRELRKMALAMYSELPEEQAIAKWVNGAGKALRQKKVL